VIMPIDGICRAKAQKVEQFCSMFEAHREILDKLNHFCDKAGITEHIQSTKGTTMIFSDTSILNLFKLWALLRFAVIIQGNLVVRVLQQFAHLTNDRNSSLVQR